MALPKIEEARKLKEEELSAAEKPHLFKHAKHRLAQLLTVEREREITAAKGE
ncbi:MAG: hypothetical protein RLZZ04_1924 [Cyanobacteriota bacterium]